MKQEYTGKIEQLHEKMEDILFKRDDNFIENKVMDDEEYEKLLYWDWTQGVGVYGIWKCYAKTKEKKYLEYLKEWYEKRFEIGLPKKNINTVAPMLALAFMYEEEKNEKYLSHILEWAEWVMKDLPKTVEGGFQHMTCEAENLGELWDDTLVMTVLFLAKAGKILGRNDYVEESKRQFFLHTKYLADRQTGLWYHGWTFEGNHNFAKALWARGNSWITIGIPEFFEIADLQGAEKMFLTETLVRQIDALEKYQHEGGMWHTLIDDDKSYLESSATAGFAYGILKSVREGYVDSRYHSSGMRALTSVLENINNEGELEKCSYGTAMGATLDFYREIPIQPMAYGQAMAMLALIEGENHE